MNDYHQQFRERFRYGSLCCNGDYCEGDCSQKLEKDIFAFIDEEISEAQVKLVEDQEAGKIPYYNNVQSEKVRKAERIALIDQICAVGYRTDIPRGASWNAAIDKLVTYLRGEDNQPQ